MEKNAALVAAIIEQDRYVYVTAREIGVHFNKLSGIITGRFRPTEEEIRKLEQHFKKDRRQLGFQVS